MNDAMSDDLRKVLRETGEEVASLMREAADRIEELTAERDELRADYDLLTASVARMLAAHGAHGDVTP